MKRPEINKERQAGEQVLLFPLLSTVMRLRKYLFQLYVRVPPLRFPMEFFQSWLVTAVVDW